MTTRSNLPLNMTRGARNAVVFLFVLNLLLTGISLLWTKHETDRINAADAAQRRAAIAIEQKLCGTLHALDADRPPAGSQPSRVYLRRQHTRLAELSPDIRCGDVRRGTTPAPSPSSSSSRSSTARSRPGGAGASGHPGGGTIAAPAPRPGSPVIVPGPAPSTVPPVTVTTTATRTVPGSRPPTPPPSSPPPTPPCTVQLLTIRLCLG